MIVLGLIGVGLLVCAVQAVRSKRLLLSALWLAGASALTALMIYRLGAPEVAVIELSVGAGLVTVLFVFAINIAGEETIPVQSIVPRPLAWLLMLSSIVMLVYLNLDLVGLQVEVEEVLQMEFKNVLWENRVLDVLLQMVLIFAGVLGVLGLLAETHPSAIKEGSR
jgi:uncharacterized MnhB-related membrane protein